MNLFLTISLFFLSLNVCYAEEKGLNDKYKTLKIAPFLTLPRLPLNLDPHFFRRPKAAEIPTMDDFFRKGFLVRSCTLTLSNDWNDVVPTSHRSPCSYWTLNSIVPVDYSDSFNNNSVVVISPFAKRWRNIISISFPEVMVTGNVTLGDGDILVLNRSKHEFFYNDKKFRENCAQKGILVTFYKGPSDSWQRTDLNKEPPLNEPRRIVNTLLKEMGGWTVEMPLGFWTPTTPAKVDGALVHPLNFFEKFLEHTPASFGSEFYTSRGSPFFLPVAGRILSENAEEGFRPRYHRALRECIKEELMRHFGEFKYFDEMAQIAVRKFLGTRPDSPHPIFRRFKTTEKTENITYADTDFILETIEVIQRLPGAVYKILKSKTPNVPSEQIEILDTILMFSKWCQSLSPALVFSDELPVSVVLAPEINRSILKKLPSMAKVDVFQHVFQLYHDRGLIDVDLAIEMFDDPVRFFKRLHKL